MSETITLKSTGPAMILEEGMDYMLTASGRNNWTRAIAEGDIAEFVCKKHVNYWDEYKNNYRDGTFPWKAAVDQLHFWELWHDFLLTIEPKTKLLLTLEDYRFFYRGVGHARELSDEHEGLAIASRRLVPHRTRPARLRALGDQGSGEGGQG